ncbi:MAG: phosphoribosylanthranilate isomerase [Gammaproteobacteria bacterium]|nr:phosphoribosylanthranilate isomerase [Gammaproteobacteria bacterium]
MKQRTRVKICGITRVEDALAASVMGVDAIGLVFYPKSPRHVSIEQAASICSQLPAFITTVALFLDAEQVFVDDVIRQLPIDLLQFHGAEDPAYCERFDRPYIKALGMASLSQEGLISQSRAYKHARGLLLDSHAEGAAGGTGETFDWNSIPDLNTPVILAGGLTVDNVSDAIRRVRPWAVDVSSGVETGKGIKNVDLMSAFMQEVENADR